MEHVAQPPEWAAALEATWLGVVMRQDPWAYPAANLVHLLGLVMLVGPILLLDLRVLGVGRRLVDLEGLSRLVTPVAVIGAALALVSGPLLFIADAKALSTSALLGAKLALLALGLMNAALFRRLHQGALGRWDERPALFGRAQAVASVAIWLGVAGAGRMIAYL